MDEKERNDGANPELAKDLDEELLGQRLPAIAWVRDALLENLRRWLDDPNKGRQWILENRQQFLAEAAILNERRNDLVQRGRKIAFSDPES